MPGQAAFLGRGFGSLLAGGQPEHGLITRHKSVAREQTFFRVVLGAWSAAAGEPCGCHPPCARSALSDPAPGPDRGLSAPWAARVALLRQAGTTYLLITVPKGQCREEVLLSSCSDTVACVDVFGKYISLSKMWNKLL